MAIHIRDYIGKKVHMVGVGGCSMSGLAGLLHDRGYIVSGCDRTGNHYTEGLRAKGIDIQIGHDAAHAQGIDLLIYSAAISTENPDRAEAERLGLPQMERATLLGQLMEDYDIAIGVSGTHGKTTTTSMLSLALTRAGVEPSIHIGGELDLIGGSTVSGKGDYFVVEACEFNATFLQFKPTVAIITNIDADHLDFYRDIDHIQTAFREYLALLPEAGLAIGCGDDMRVREVIRSAKAQNKLLYGFTEHCDIRAVNIGYDAAGRARFTALWGDKKLGEVRMGVPGAFNVLNALATIAVAAYYDLDMNRIIGALEEFRNAHRRFEFTGRTPNGVNMYHDYAHHPTEIAAALSVAKLVPHQRLIAVFQPHTYSRSKALFDAFASCFSDADIVLVLDICAAREKDPGDINGRMLAEAIEKQGKHVVFTGSFESTRDWILREGQSDDLAMTLGCGDVNLLNEMLASIRCDTEEHHAG